MLSTNDRCEALAENLAILGRSLFFVAAAVSAAAAASDWWCLTALLAAAAGVACGVDWTSCFLLFFLGGGGRTAQKFMKNSVAS